jgi:nitronate monooxygenase
MAGRNRARLSGTDAAPHAVNLIVRRSNSRLDADLEVIVRHRVPLVIASLGANAEVVQAVQAYGGAVFRDVISRRHAEKAAEEGVDGRIAGCAGAGGTAGRSRRSRFCPRSARFSKGPWFWPGRYRLVRRSRQRA